MGLLSKSNTSHEVNRVHTVIWATQCIKTSCRTIENANIDMVFACFCYSIQQSLTKARTHSGKPLMVMRNPPSKLTWFHIGCKGFSHIWKFACQSAHTRHRKTHLRNSILECLTNFGTIWGCGSKFQTTHTLKNSPNMNKIDYAGLLFWAPSVWKISLLGFDPSSHASCASLEKTDLLSKWKPQTCNRKIVQSSLSRRGAAKIYNYSISYIFSMIWESPHTCHGKTTMGIGAEFGPSFFL